MKNPTQRQMVAIGVACLFGIPICAGIAVGHFAGFWAGVIVAVLTIVIIATIAQRWWNKQAGQKGKDNDKGTR